MSSHQMNDFRPTLLVIFGEAGKEHCKKTCHTMLSIARLSQLFIAYTQKIRRNYLINESVNCYE